MAEVPEDMKEQAGNIFAAAQEVLSSEQLESAAQDLVAALGPAAEQSAEAEASFGRRIRRDST